MIRKVILLVFLINPLVSYAQSDSSDNIITFRVISKPTRYAAKIHITGNHPQLRNWASPGIPLEERSDGVWEKTFSFKKGTQLEYDFNLGSFESIGLDSSGNMLGDSIFHAGAISQHSHSFLEVMNDTTVTARIPQWRQGKIHLFADNLNKGSIWLAFLCQYHPGDNEEWANPEFDDSSWELVRPALRPNELPKNGWQGVGWFRLHIVIDSTLFNKPLGLSIWQAGASQIYLDGTLIYTFGEHSDDWTGAPKVITFAGKKRHVIAVRYSNLSVKKFHRAGFDAGFFLRLGNVNRMAEDRIRYERPLIGFQWSFTSLSLALGLLHLILFAFSPGVRQNLYFALFLFSYATVIFFDYQASLSTDIGQNLFFLRIHRAVLPLWFLLQLRFVYSLFYKALPKRFWLISLIAVSVGVLLIYKPLENFELFYIIIAATSIEISGILFYFRKKEGTWIIILAFLVFWFFANLDTLMDAGINVPFREMQNPFAFGVIGFFIAMSVYLSRDFARANKKLVEQEMEQKLLEAENARQSKELEEARQLQLSMLPKCVNEIPGLDICFHMETATEVGGDYYDYHLADDGTLTIAIGDATGHGMKAGTMVAVIKSLFIAEASQTDILSFFKKCTQTIKQMRLGNLYMAMMLIKIKDYKMTVSSAGIPPIYIYRNETKSVEEIVIKGMPLGGPAFSYQMRETNLAPGDTVLLMSDGFAELFNDKDEMLDYPRVKEIFKEAAERSADEIVAHLFKAGERWSNGRAQDDDITFVVLKVKQNGKL